MKREINFALIHLCAALVWSLVVTMSATAQAVDRRGVVADLGDQAGKAARAISQPATTTTLMEKGEPAETLLDWYAAFSSSREDEPKLTYVDGYPALIFSINLDGEYQRGVAIDLGGGKVLLHQTTDREVSDEFLGEAVKPFLKEALSAAQTYVSQGLECNCVLWARSQAPSLPTGLTYYSGKLAIINHRFARVGSVAIHNTGNSIGHVSVVRNVAVNHDGSLNVTIQEANYTSCQITWRTGTPEALKIQGYFDPAYRPSESAPRLDSISPTSGVVGRQITITANGLGFDARSVRVIVLGSGCSSFGSCIVPNNVLTERSSTRIRAPITINNPGTYHIYLSNSASGKTSNGKKVTIY